MEDLKKVNSDRLYAFWKNFAIGLLILILMIGLNMLLPVFFSPIIALIAAAALYTILYNNRLTRKSNCMLVIYALFFGLVGFSFVEILVNIIDIWEVIPYRLPKAFSFFNAPFLPSLLLDPIIFITVLIVYFRRKHLSICINCKLASGDYAGSSRMAQLLSTESYLQLRNLILIFGLLSIITWGYYLFSFVEVNMSGKDYYVFVWLNIIILSIDELYFAFRYFNIYIDLKENNELISQEELNDMSSKTFIRYYVICDNQIFINPKTIDNARGSIPVLDTPFYTKRSVSGMTVSEIHKLIKRMTGVGDGELRFFFGRKNPGSDKNSTLRYFYFLDGKPEDYPEMNVEGEWVDFENIKKIYSYQPQSLGSTMVSDITRMATIILTQKIFNEDGFRKIKLKSYRPSFNLIEVKRNNYDFQEDKWIKISLFNSDTKLYRLKKWWRGIKKTEKAASQGW
ncbi:MAG: hypothetical protein K2M13_01510 [Muribaculaceae bacterium]|nr:hypothetical protein [Muribaculaceae bacterium]